MRVSFVSVGIMPLRRVDTTGIVRTNDTESDATATGQGALGEHTPTHHSATDVTATPSDQGYRLDLVDGVILWFRPDDFPAPQVYRELQIRNLRSGQWETMAMPHKTVERIWLDFDVHRFAAAGRRQMCVVDGK